jgi:hypothetical protein
MEIRRVLFEMGTVLKIWRNYSKCVRYFLKMESGSFIHKPVQYFLKKFENSEALIERVRHFEKWSKNSEGLFETDTVLKIRRNYSKCLR